jgi:hypothetical protein
MFAKSSVCFSKKILVAMVEGSDDEQCESDGDEQGEADERVEQREAGARGTLVGIRRVWRWGLGVGLRGESFGVGHCVAPS